MKISVDIEQIENALDDNFLKPSELLQEVVPRVDEIVISGITNREQIEIVDFIIPFKSDLTINLNNYQPIEQIDRFSFENRVEYGFEHQKILVKFDRVEEVSGQFNFSTGIGINELRVYKTKNAIDATEIQEINIIENPSNIILNFEY